MRQWVISIIIIVFISSCQKQVAYLTVEDKIADKEWFLERYVAPGVNIIYKGLSTFSFQLDRSRKAYIDSDGIEGVYELQEHPIASSLQINANGRFIEVFIIRQIDKRELVIEYSKNNSVITLFFSTRL
ncbi:MAG: hypothetical protein ACKN9Q_06990 [Bacteroidota bacterium]